MNRYDANLSALDPDRWSKISDQVQSVEARLVKLDLLVSYPDLAPEFARFKRAVEFLSQTASTVQPYAEFVPLDIQRIISNVENRLNHLSSENLNQFEGQITQLNNDVTEILQLVSPYHSEPESARLAGQAFSQLRKDISDAKEELQRNRYEAAAALEIVNRAQEEIVGYRDDLLVGRDGRHSVATDVQHSFDKMQRMLAETDETYKKLKEGDSGSASIEYQIHESLTQILSDREKIADQLEDSSAKLKALERIYGKVVGTATDEGTHENGLEEQLLQRGHQLDLMIEGFETKHTALFAKIEGLLPGATSAGLSTAYSTLRERAQTSERRYSIAFYLGVVLLIGIAATSVTETISLQPFVWEFTSINQASDYLEKILPKLPFVVPILWATLTLSKRRSEMHRLAEEYAHKEALAKTYDGFKRQIEDLGQTDNKLIVQLLEVILGAMSKNAAQTLEGKHGDKLPSSEVLAVLEGVKPK